MLIIKEYSRIKLIVNSKKENIGIQEVTWNASLTQAEISHLRKKILAEEAAALMKCVHARKNKEWVTLFSWQIIKDKRPPLAIKQFMDKKMLFALLLHFGDSGIHSISYF